MTPQIFDVCAIGNAIVDIIADSDDDFLSKNGITKGSMSLIDAERADSLYKKIGPAIEASGGSAANTVAGIASFGGSASFIGKVRNDQLGDIFRHDMQAIGVDFSTPPLTSGAPTARCIILVTPDAQRSMNTYLGACVELSPADIDARIIKNSGITYLEGYLFDKPSAQEAFLLAGQIAHAHGKKIALTLSDPFCVERHREAFRQLVEKEIDVLFANEHELMALYQSPNFDSAMTEARKHCEIVAGTRSEKGAVIARGDKTISIKAEPVERVIDSTGAGDMFAAGFLFGLSQKADLEKCGRLGAIAAAEVISHHGPRPLCSLKSLTVIKESLPTNE